MRRVLKIGGSLLRQETIARRVQDWVSSQEQAETFAIVGGGELIDAIRRLDALSPGDPDSVHWQCVELLQITFSWLARQLDGWTPIHGTEDFDHLRWLTANQHEPPPESTRYLMDVNSFYRPGDETPLPEDWTTTTDAIAGWLSILLRADELVLFKSCDVDPQASLDELAARGIIDSALPRLADRLPPIRLVNLATETIR